MTFKVKNPKKKEGKSVKNNPYFVDGKDVSKIPIYELESENNGLTENQEIALWQYGVDTGIVWQLQGWYGRNAQAMLDEGILKYPKKKHYDYYGNPIPKRKKFGKEGDYLDMERSDD